MLFTIIYFSYNFTYFPMFGVPPLGSFNCKGTTPPGALWGTVDPDWQGTASIANMHQTLAGFQWKFTKHRWNFVAKKNKFSKDPKHDNR